MSLKSKLLRKIQSEGRVEYGALCQLTMEEGYKIASQDRRLRELAEASEIWPIEATSKRGSKYIAAYCAKKVERQVESYSIEIIDGRPVAVRGG